MGRQRRSQKSKAPDRATNPTIPWLRGLAAMGDERWEEAIAALQRFLELSVRPHERHLAYYNQASCYAELERYDEALAALDEAERCLPADPETLYSRGVTCACAARLPEAIAAFEQFTRRWPPLARQRQVRRTLRYLRRIQRGELPPGDYLVDHLQGQIHHNVEIDDLVLVERKARRMIAANPQRPEGHFALGVAGLELGHFPEALEAFRSALARDPDHEPTLYNVGHTYLQMGRPEEALPWLERSLRREPRKLATLHQLGVACEQLGRRDEAVSWWRRALTVDPHYELAQWRLHEVGQGPPPPESPLSPHSLQLRKMIPIAKARMRRPLVRRCGDLTLTYDGQVGFVLEDAGNALNATVYAGGPFRIVELPDEDLLDLLGLTKLLLRMAEAGNARDIAVLIYYADGAVFNYQRGFTPGQSPDIDAHGRFIATAVPRLFKLRIDSDFSTPYGDPMQGNLIYLSQHRRPGILVSTLGLLGEGEGR